MAAIGRFQKGDEIFYAKVVDGDLYRLHGDVFGSPSFDKKPISFKGLKTLTPVVPSKLIAIGLNYADHALSLIHISEPTRQAEISYAVFCLKKKKQENSKKKKKNSKKN